MQIWRLRHSDSTNDRAICARTLCSARRSRELRINRQKYGGQVDWYIYSYMCLCLPGIHSVRVRYIHAGLLAPHTTAWRRTTFLMWKQGARARAWQLFMRNPLNNTITTTHQWHQVVAPKNSLTNTICMKFALLI